MHSRVLACDSAAYFAGQLTAHFDAEFTVHFGAESTVHFDAESAAHFDAEFTAQLATERGVHITRIFHAGRLKALLDSLYRLIIKFALFV